MILYDDVSPLRRLFGHDGKSGYFSGDRTVALLASPRLFAARGLCSMLGIGATVAFEPGALLGRVIASFDVRRLAAIATSLQPASFAILMGRFMSYLSREIAGVFNIIPRLD